MNKIKKWFINSLLKFLSKEISQIKEELRFNLDLVLQQERQDHRINLDNLIAKLKDLPEEFKRNELELKQTKEALEKTKKELDKYLISDILQKSTFRVIRNIEQKFPGESGEFKRAQALRSLMNIHPEAPERDISYAIEKGVREFQR